MVGISQQISTARNTSLLPAAPAHDNDSELLIRLPERAEEEHAGMQCIGCHACVAMWSQLIPALRGTLSYWSALLFLIGSVIFAMSSATWLFRPVYDYEAAKDAAAYSGLVSYPFLAGAIMFEFAASFGYVDAVLTIRENRRGRWCSTKGLLTAAHFSALGYMCGATIFIVALSYGVVPSTFAKGWHWEEQVYIAPSVVGSCCFALAGACEVYHNVRLAREVVEEESETDSESEHTAVAPALRNNAGLSTAIDAALAARHRSGPPARPADSARRSHAAAVLDKLPVGQLILPKGGLAAVTAEERPLQSSLRKGSLASTSKEPRDQARDDTPSRSKVAHPTPALADIGTPERTRRASMQPALSRGAGDSFDSRRTGQDSRKRSEHMSRGGESNRECVPSDVWNVSAVRRRAESRRLSNNWTPGITPGARTTQTNAVSEWTEIADARSVRWERDDETGSMLPAAVCNLLAGSNFLIASASGLANFGESGKDYEWLVKVPYLIGSCLFAMSSWLYIRQWLLQNFLRPLSDAIAPQRPQLGPQPVTGFIVHTLCAAAGGMRLCLAASEAKLGEADAAEHVFAGVAVFLAGGVAFVVESAGLALGIESPLPVHWEALRWAARVVSALLCITAAIPVVKVM